ncbi:MAG: transketolase family protein [Thermoanaerobaculaceae bacterium]|nr:transketolase family protein [Thermoanaerobaculaceae bacterium]
MEKKGTRDYYGKTLLELGRENPNIVALDADLSASTKTCLFAKEFPERFFDCGVAEADMIGTAAGLSLCGFIPFASTFAVFGTGRCYDQIRQSVCISNTNVKIVVTHGGITVGEDGATHQMLEDIALMTSLPNMRVIVPADAHQTSAVIKFIAKEKGPFFVRLSRDKFPVIYGEETTFHLPFAEVLKEGKDIAIFSTGLMVHHSLNCAENLSKSGIDAEVINVASIKPLDKETIVKSARKCKMAVTLEEHSVINGLGAQISSLLSEEFPVPLKIFGVEDRFGISGKPDELLKFFGLDSETLTEKIKNFIEKRRG